MRNRAPLNVLFTVDTEAWPCSPNWREEQLSEEIRRYIYGIAEDGEFGLDFQCKMLQHYGLKGTFFVESLFATAVGTEPLRRIVESIMRYPGQGVELHAHLEWARYFDPPAPLVAERCKHFHQLSPETQIIFLDLAARNLQAAGIEKINAFRAGNYGADLDTCRAVSVLGIPFDFSYNAELPFCKMRREVGLLTQPAYLRGITEYPTSFFEDYPGHFRHTQLCACSFMEMRHALLQAWEKGWQYFVILSHTFELIRDRDNPDRRPRLNPIALRRMEKLFRFLENENDRFVTVTCDGLEPQSSSASGPRLHGRLLNTLARYGEQAWNRLT